MPLGTLEAGTHFEHIPIALDVGFMTLTVTLRTPFGSQSAELRVR